MKKCLTRTVVLILGVSWLLLAACSDNNNITTTLGVDTTVSINDPVYFQDTIIGQVTAVSPGSADTQIDIHLHEDALARLSSDAVALENTLKPDFPLEIHNGLTEPGTLAPGSKIHGMDNMVEFSAWTFGNIASLGASSLNRYIQPFVDHINSADYANQKEQLDEAIQQSTELAKQTINQIEQALAKNADQLQKVEDQLIVTAEQVHKEIEAIIKGLEKSGTDMYQELDNLNKHMKSPIDSESQSDGHPLNVLLAMLKNLNSGLDDTATEPQETTESEGAQN